VKQGSKGAVEADHLRINWSTGLLLGSTVQERIKTLRQLRGLFYDAKSCQQMDPDMTVYRVRWWEPVPEGTEGGLFWGTTTIEPGRVGDEYFMTHGHSHLRHNRAEIYGTIAGNGALVLADAGGRTWMEEMTPGSTHYIRGDVAHRVANVGKSPLVFVACWPSDAGHDYQTIATKGFGAHLLCRHGVPTLVRDLANAG
jgi:glucose-6-phosphate isomerase, archaeal